MLLQHPNCDWGHSVSCEPCVSFLGRVKGNNSDAERQGSRAGGEEVHGNTGFGSVGDCQQENMMEQREKGIKNNFYSKRHIQFACKSSKKEVVLSWIWILSNETVSCSLSLTVLRGAKFHVHLFVCNKIASKKYCFSYWFPSFWKKSHFGCLQWVTVVANLFPRWLFGLVCAWQLIHQRWGFKCCFQYPSSTGFERSFTCRKPGMFPVGSFSSRTAVPHA